MLWSTRLCKVTYTATTRSLARPHSLSLLSAGFRPRIAKMSTISIPKTMKAIQVPRAGGPEVLEMREIPVPEPSDDQVLIKVQWTGTNFIDTYERTGLYPKQMPFTNGRDAVGTLVKLPKAAMSDWSLPKLELGQTVTTTAGPSFAEYMVAPWHKVAPLPKEVSKEDGVSMGTIAATAMYLIKESYPVKEGEWVLVRAAAGGVGLVLCQLGRYFKFNVIGTVSTPEKAELAKANGAKHVLLTTNSSEDNVKEILRLTGGKGVHAVYDGVGKDTFDEDFEVVRPKGTIASFGNASGRVPDFSIYKAMPKSLKIMRPTLAPYIAEPEDFAWYMNQIFDVIKNGGLKFTVHKVYPFTAEGARQTHEDIASRKTVGKLLVKVSD